MNNVTGSVAKYVLLTALFGGIYGCGQKVVDEIDLNLVLDVTVDTLTNYQDELDMQAKSEPDTKPDPDKTFLGFSEALAVNYNKSQPAIYKSQIGVVPQNDASLVAFDDANANQDYDQGEATLFMIEIDGEKSRIIASSRSGAVNDHYFSGTSLLAGYLIGSMLTRQRGAGVNPKNLSNKKPVTSKAAARSRAGSGSHSKGK